jgi:hypothetical protein
MVAEKFSLAFREAAALIDELMDFLTYGIGFCFFWFWKILFC